MVAATRSSTLVEIEHFDAPVPPLKVFDSPPVSDSMMGAAECRDRSGGDRFAVRSICPGRPH
jgi:hypothetical protein